MVDPTNRQVSGPVDDVATVVRRGALWVIGAVALIAVVGAPAVASWHGLVGFGRHELGLSGGLEYVVPVSLDGAALYAAVLAMRAILSAASAIWPRVLTGVYALASAAFNAHAAPTTPAAVFYAGASVSAVVLWDTTLRMLRRDQLRELGAIQDNSARYRPLRWVLAPDETARAWRTAVLEDIVDPKSALRVVRGQEALPAPDGPSVDQLPSGGEQLPDDDETSGRVHADAERVPPRWDAGPDDYLGAGWLSRLVIASDTAGGSSVPPPRVELSETPDPAATAREKAFVRELNEAETKADALHIAWRALGVEGDPETSDVMPAVEWLAEHGVTVDRSRAYDVRRKLVQRRTANGVRPSLVRGDQ